MKIIEPSYEILTPINRDFILKLIESAGRVCYKSEDKITPESASRFVNNLCQVKKHHSIIEHVSFSVRFICDRGVTHEMVRHRLAAYSQESTRYANYSKGKFDNQITVIRPPFFEQDSQKYNIWKIACASAERDYMELLAHGAKPEEARSILPNSLKTEIVMTANLREWKHVFELRCSEHAHPQIRQVMIPLRDEIKVILPEIFD